jgi:hypothetical protein
LEVIIAKIRKEEGLVPVIKAENFDVGVVEKHFNTQQDAKSQFSHKSLRSYTSEARYGTKSNNGDYISRAGSQIVHNTLLAQSLNELQIGSLHQRRLSPGKSMQYEDPAAQMNITERRWNEIV